MGIFFEPRRIDPEVHPALENALFDFSMRAPPASAADVNRIADERTDALVTDFPALYQPYYRPLFHDALAGALQTPIPATVPLAWKQATRRARKVLKQAGGSGEFQTQRFLFAVLIFVAVVGGAAGADAAGLPDSSKALYAFGASIFGVIVGILGGETSK